MEEQAEVVEIREVPNELSFGRRFLRFLLRLFVVIIIGAALGIGAYYGIPALYRDFIEPIQSNSDRIAALEESVARVQVDFREKNAMLVSNLAGVEGEIAQQREDLSELTVGEEGLFSRVTDIEQALEDSQLLPNRIEDLEESQRALAIRFDAFEESIGDREVPYERLAAQLQLLRVMELVTRARLWMMQSNLGEASEDLTLAKDALENLEIEDGDEETLMLIVDRLDQVLLEISLNPIIAADDLEIVWQYLLLATEP
jgi:hypothetical protein